MEYILQVDTWNVKRVNKLQKLENLKREMDWLEFDVVTTREVNCRDEEDFWLGEYRIMNIVSQWDYRSSNK